MFRRCFGLIQYPSKFVEISNEGKNFTSKTIELGGHVLREGRVMAFKGHSCKTGNVRYGGTSKTQN